VTGLATLGVGPPAPPRRPPRRPPSRLARRPWPIGCTALVLVAGLVTWFVIPAVEHHRGWMTPGDIWGAYRSAHLVVWGDFGGIYAAGTHLVAFPGLLLLFAPLAALTGALGMSESYPFALPHPTAWLVLGPYELLLGCVALFAFDALAERLGVARGRRGLLCLAEAVVLFNVTAVWGHPEDALGLGLAAYALLAALDGRWRAAGWLAGAAVATQPLVLLMLPVVLALTGRRQVLPFVVRALAPAVVLLALPVAAEFRTTINALVSQPNYPNMDHRTPWTALAPRLGGHGQDLAVAGGPGRILAVLVACGIGLWAARRWRDRPDMIVWGCALALALRCATESVMDPYYAWPAVALGLVVASLRLGQLLVTGVFAVFVTVFGDYHLSQWAWWLPVTGAIVAVLGASVPMYPERLGRRSAPSAPPVGADMAGLAVGTAG